MTFHPLYLICSAECVVDLFNSYGLTIDGAVLQGVNGFIKFIREPEFPILIEKNGVKEEIYIEQPKGMGYELEAIHVMECLDKGLTQSPVLPLSASRDLMEILDWVRKDAGIVFPKHD